MKKFILIFISFLFLNPIIKAQFSDDFSDGNFSQNPTWIWQADSFIVNAKKELQLNAKAGGISKITSNYNCEQAMVWEFLVRMEFAPSQSNRLFVLLNADGNASNSAGYALQLGEDGTTDKIKLLKYQTTPSAGTVLATCATNLVVNNLVNTRIRVKRDANNLWSIEADYNGSFGFKQDLSFQETSPFPLVKNTNFGFWCEYTDSRKDKFFFDDIKVSKNELDITPPTVVSVAQDSKIANRVNVVFSEVVDSLSAKAVLAYTIDNGAGLPKITYNFDRVALDYPNLKAGTAYNLQIATILDLAKNVMQPKSFSFTTTALPTTTQLYDIIINEIMADPLPQIGLPKSEFVELYNRSTKTIDLQGFSLKDKGTTTYKFPKISLAPDKYLIVYKRDKGIDFGKYGDTLAFTTFFALDSDNEEITLFNEKNETIDKVNYDLLTYKDEKKADGGWTLERINPSTPCLGGFNFIASQNDDGGTPGKKNSVFSNQNNDVPLLVTYVFPTNADEVFIRFNKNVDLNTLQNSGFEIETGIKNVVIGASLNEAKITLSTPFQKGKIYNLKVKNTLKDCIGNSASEGTFTLGLPESIAAKDVVINEILFNPKTGGIDFVELYNRSSKIININDLNIDNQKKLDVQEINENYLLMPNAYVVLTENKGILLAQGYDIKNPNAIVQTNLPTFDDDEGNVQLIKADAPGKLLIDAVDYDKSYHYPLLKDQSGVSLERINPNGESNDKNNWYSAASTVGFATPTYQNSQFSKTQVTQNERFSLENTRLSPDGDSFEDYLLLGYKNDIIGLTATVQIYDFDGRLAKTLVNNELLSTEGNFRWDGDTDNGTIAPLGIYIVLIRYFSPDGTIGQEKKVVSVVGRL
jgi:hypothetical protein